ncbi:MAG TPA: carboxypeptidase regulatory-like domain-containing protein [Polyangiaceae bacterium]|nr:carboxypeptidase regulatory-like domain-containing protein [Polyangiaceae bacterium]
MGVWTTPKQALRALAVVCLLAPAGCLVSRAIGRRGGEPAADGERSGGRALRAAPPVQCGASKAGAIAARLAAPEGNAEARAGAQRGLAFVAREAQAWQAQHRCYGCHVQAVTLEALSVGRQHRYEVPESDLDAIRGGMLTLSGGARGPNGLSLRGDTYLIETAKEFGAAAFARYDEFVGPGLRDELVRVAGELLEYQQPDGSVRASRTSLPVEAGALQATTQAMQAFRRAYAHSADEQRWLGPLRQAEAFVQARAAALSDDANANVVDVNYALIGLLSAGAQGGEATMRALAARLRGLQRADGGWGFTPGEDASAFATGQSLYALRLLGAGDGDPAVARGTAWLLAHQAGDGGWSHAGRGKAEAMWAVLGLVSVDVLSVAVTGVEDGQHLRGSVPIRAKATSNGGEAVERVEISVDDVPVHRACGAGAEYALDAGALDAGVHTIEIAAKDARGRTSRRRLEVYSGAHYLTRLGARFERGQTQVSLRNVAPKGTAGRVVFKVFAAGEGPAARGPEVHKSTHASSEGPMIVSWDGRDPSGEPRPKGRYVAELSFVDEGGRTLQSAELPFVHDTPEAQQAAFGEIAGALTVNGQAPAANTWVDLVDERGRVVQRALTTEAGNYRFRNVDGGRYRVRVDRKGFHQSDAPAAAAPAKASEAPTLDLKIK